MGAVCRGMHRTVGTGGDRTEGVYTLISWLSYFYILLITHTGQSFGMSIEMPSMQDRLLRPTPGT